MLDFYKRQYEFKAPKKLGEMENLRAQIADTDREAEELERQMGELKERPASFTAASGQFSVHQNEDNSAASEGIAVAGHGVHREGTPATQISLLEHQTLFARRELALARRRVVSKRQKVEKLKQNLPPEGSASYVSSRGILQAHERDLTAEKQRVAELIAKLGDLQSQQLELYSQTPGSGPRLQGRHHYARLRTKRRKTRLVRYMYLSQQSTGVCVKDEGESCKLLPSNRYSQLTRFETASRVLPQRPLAGGMALGFPAAGVEACLAEGGLCTAEGLATFAVSLYRIRCVHLPCLT